MLTRWTKTRSNNDVMTHSDKSSKAVDQTLCLHKQRVRTWALMDRTFSDLCKGMSESKVNLIRIKLFSSKLLCCSRRLYLLQAGLCLCTQEQLPLCESDQRESWDWPISHCLAAQARVYGNSYSEDRRLLMVCLAELATNMKFYTVDSLVRLIQYEPLCGTLCKPASRFSTKG
jgi:hypothetical protein